MGFFGDQKDEMLYEIEQLESNIFNLEKENSRLAEIIIGLRGKKEAYALLGEGYRPPTSQKTESS